MVNQISGNIDLCASQILQFPINLKIINIWCMISATASKTGGMLSLDA